MTRSQIKDEIKDIITAIAPDEDITRLTDDGIIREQLELDSMDFLDIIMELRKRHKIEVPEADYPNFVTLDKCADYLEPRMASS